MVTKLQTVLLLNSEMVYSRLDLSWAYKGVTLVLIIGMAGCVSSASPGDTTNDVSLGHIVFAATRIVGDCNIVVNVVNSSNANVGNSLQCANPRNRRAIDIQYCSQESKRQYFTLHPGGLLTLPLFPFLALGNYIGKKSAESDADQVFTACMEARGHIMNGYGIYTFENGNKYQGNWRDGAFNGQGVFYWKDGGSYSGDWKDGLKSGNGFEVYVDGIKYKGAFENDMRNGYGVMTWPNGRHFEGTFRDEKPNGSGVFTAADGERYDGYWSNGCFNDGDRWAIVNQDETYCR